MFWNIADRNKKKFEIKFYIEILYKKTVAITLNIETKQKIIHFQSKKNEVTFTSRNFVCFHRMKKKRKTKPRGTNFNFNSE